MRLRSKNEKIKIIFTYFSFGFFIAFALLCLVRLDVSAASTENVQYTSYPLPVGFDGYGIGGMLTEEIANGIIEASLSAYQNVDMICVTQIWDSNEFNVNIYTSLNGINFFGNADNLYFQSYMTYSGYGDMRDYRANLGGFTDIPYTLGGGRCEPSNYVLPNPQVGEEIPTAYLIKSYIPYYPIYINPDLDPSVYSAYFTLGNTAPGHGGSVGGSASGGSISSGTITFSDGTTATIDLDGNITLDFELDFDDSSVISKLNELLEAIENNGVDTSGIQTSLNTLISGNSSVQSKIDSSNYKLDEIKAKLDSINGKLTDSTDGESWLKKIYILLQQNFSVPSFDDLDEELEDTPLSDLLEIPSESAQTFVDMFNADAKTSQQMSDIVYNFEWDTTDSNTENYSFFHVFQTIHFSFAWYESIRDRFLIVLFTFIYATVIVFTIKKVPQIINGAGSAVGSGQSVSDQNQRKGGN